MPPSAAQRDIPPEIIYQRPSVPEDFGDGAALMVDKPEGVTSHDVVDALRRMTAARKVGHAGTLDPMATGLLIVLVARPATRLQAAFMHLPKVYEGTMQLGARTPSHDAETDIESRTDPSHLTLKQIQKVCDEYQGTITQTPPLYSAVKVDGERLYRKARRGETAKRPPRQVRIDAFDLLAWDAPALRFRVECSKGTYIRALARDVGADLNVGAHLTALRRHAIGEHDVDAAWPLDSLLNALSADAPPHP